MSLELYGALSESNAIETLSKVSNVYHTTEARICRFKTNTLLSLPLYERKDQQLVAEPWPLKANKSGGGGPMERASHLCRLQLCTGTALALGKDQLARLFVVHQNIYARRVSSSLAEDLV